MQNSSEPLRPRRKLAAGKRLPCLPAREQSSRFDVQGLLGLETSWGDVATWQVNPCASEHNATHNSSEAMWRTLVVDTPDECDANTTAPSMLVGPRHVAWQVISTECVPYQTFQYTTVHTQQHFENSGGDDGAVDPAQAVGDFEEPVLQAVTTGHDSGQQSNTRRRKRFRRRGGRFCRAMGRAPLVESLNAKEGLTPAELKEWETQCAQLTEYLRGDSEDQFRAASELYGRVWIYSRNVHGCRVVQLALQKHRFIAEKVTVELHGHVREAISSPYANFVIQRVIEVMPMAQFAFVARELIGLAADTARHRFGCRILIRLLEHSTDVLSDTLALADELLETANVIELCWHPFGHHVIQAILEHGLPQQRHRIAEALLSRNPESDATWSLLRCALSRHASHVLESVATHCSADDRSALCDALLDDSDAVLEMADCPCGAYVLLSLLSHSANPTQVTKACGAILSISDRRWRSSKHGRKMLDFVQSLNVGPATP